MFKNTPFLKYPFGDFALKTLISLALLCFLGPVKIDFQASIPITLQTLMVLFAAIAFGRNIGLIAVGGYLLLGLAGVPVFAGKVSGLEVLSGPTGGYLFGFVMAALVIGHLAEKIEPRQPFHHFGLWIGGHLLIVVLGLIWQLNISGESLNQSLGLIKLLAQGAMIKSAVGMLAIMLIHRAFTPREAFYSKKTN